MIELLFDLFHRATRSAEPWAGLEAAERELCDLPARYVILGVGAPRFMDFFRRLAAERPWQWNYQVG